MKIVLLIELWMRGTTWHRAESYHETLLVLDIEEINNPAIDKIIETKLVENNDLPEGGEDGLGNKHWYRIKQMMNAEQQ